MGMKTLAQVAYETRLTALGMNPEECPFECGTKEFQDTWTAVAQAVITEYERRQWRPIDAFEPSNDGIQHRILVGCPSGHNGSGSPGWVYESYFDFERSAFYEANVHESDVVGGPIYPTHFRLLPAPPEGHCK